MKKPEKKDSCIYGDSDYERGVESGYNWACDDYEKFLPSEEEINCIIFEQYPFMKEVQLVILAKAISKRLRGE